jgi:hypothetical protein
MRSIGGILGLRVFTVTVAVRSTAGPRPGTANTTTTPVQLTNTGPDGTLYPVMVKQVSRRDLIASGGLYVDGDYKVGPITPPYPAGLFGIAGGFDDTTVDPPLTANPARAVEIIWHMTGPGLPQTTGAVMERVDGEATGLHRYVVLRRTGRR